MFLKCQGWGNEQDYIHECCEISGIPESFTDKDLEWSIRSLFEKIGIEVYPNYFEAFHW